jgi:transposase-like protein
MISDVCLNLTGAVAEVLPKADWKRCALHFYRNVLSHVTSTKVREVPTMLNTIYARECLEAAETHEIKGGS